MALAALVSVTESTATWWVQALTPSTQKSALWQVTVDRRKHMPCSLAAWQSTQATTPICSQPTNEGMASHARRTATATESPASISARSSGRPPPTFFTLHHKELFMPRPRTSTLRVECLENREVPATFNVTTTLDLLDPADGKRSLREAITLANKNAGADVIVLPAGVFNITRAGTSENANIMGDFDI